MSELKFGGYKFVEANPGARLYSPPAALTPPRKVDLRPLMTPVEDQGGLQSCAANAIAGAYEYLIKKHARRHIDLSRLFIYFNARWRNGEQNEDAGSVIQYGMESLQSFGACNETTWPYDEQAVLQKPKKRSYVEAERLKALDMQKVGVTLDHWKRCLAEGYPIVFGCALFRSFDARNKQRGVVPMPDPGRTWVENDNPLIRGFDPETINRLSSTADDVLGHILFDGFDYSDDTPPDFRSFYESLSGISTFVRERFAEFARDDEEEADADDEDEDWEEEGEEDEEGDDDDEDDDGEEEGDEEEIDDEEEEEDDWEEDGEDEEDEEESDEEEEEDGEEEYDEDEDDDDSDEDEAEDDEE